MQSLLKGTFLTSIKIDDDKLKRFKIRYTKNSLCY